MIWLILGVVSLVLIFLLLEKTDGGSLLFMLLVMPPIILVIAGVITYPDLLKSQSEVLALKSEIETVRNAYYNEGNTPTLVGGSLTNLQQSTALAEYIKNYSEKKAEYNGNLKAYQFIKSSRVYFWFGNAPFISKEVLELKPM